MAELWRYSVLGCTFTIVVATALILLVPALVPLFYGQNFAAAVGSGQLLVAGSAILSCRRLLADGARGLGFPLVGSVAELLSWALFVPLAVWLAPKYSIEGIAIAVIAGGIGAAILVLASLSKPGRDYWSRVTPVVD
jgi:O-antigen/teichoic acid export membrane protein